MKILNKYIFKELLYPFILSLFILVFVLLTQFLVKHLDRFLGKDLPFSTIVQFLIFNSASIISLAAPMAVLIATMMTFGRLSSDNEITGFKSSGISNTDFLKPGLLFGIIIVSLMIPFNLWILPEMNHNIRKLSYKISKNRPDIEIRENMLNSIYEKMIFVGDRINKKSFSDIVIFDKKSNSTILANQGEFNSFFDGLILNLKNGSIHDNIKSKKNENKKIYFDDYKIIIPYNQINIGPNKKIIRQDREMDFNLLTSEISKKKFEVDSLQIKNNFNSKKINELEIKYKNLSNEINIIKIKNGVNNPDYKSKSIDLNKVKTSINNFKNNTKKNDKIIPVLNSDINKYSVEYHKKFAIPIACFIFILLGIPIGIISKKGNFSISIAVSLGFFILYWALLTIGEFLGDDGKLHPFLAVWLGNFLIGILSLYLFYVSSTENNFIKSGINTLMKNFNNLGEK